MNDYDKTRPISPLQEFFKPIAKMEISVRDYNRLIEKVNDLSEENRKLNKVKDIINKLSKEELLDLIMKVL
jgi:hypothetical protein